jgi:hypothetical protein
MWWSQLSEMLQSIEREEGGRHTLKKRDTHEILEELLELVRAQQRGLMQAWEHDDYTQSQMLDTLLTRFHPFTTGGNG